MDQPRTNKQIAGYLYLSPATTHHHVRILLDHGFLEPQPARIGRRGAREVPYLSTAKCWHTHLPDAARLLMNTFLLEVANADPPNIWTAAVGLRLDAAQQQEFTDALRELVDSYATRPPTPGGRPISLFVTVHEDPSRR